MKFCRSIILTTLLLLAVACMQAQQTSILPPGLDKYIDSVLQIFEVPGLSLAIVKDGKVIMTKGYGEKKLGSKIPVTAHSLFSIASNTKAFTATAICLLVEEGKLKWDDPVIKYLPWFRMSDPWVSAEMNVRDLLVHHSGIPGFAGDILIFPPSDYSRRQIVEKLSLIPLIHSFRSSYAYDNILYLAAGELIKSVSGMEWEDFIQTRILDKLDMKESISRFSNFKLQTDVSSGHTRVKEKVQADDHFFEQAIGDAGNPAGGIASNAIDMAKWLITQLDSGQLQNGARLYSSVSTRDLWNIVTPIPVNNPAPGLAPSKANFRGYALGLNVYNYGKYKIIGHGGKLDGFVSQLAMVPDLKLGIAVLTNQESTGAYWSVIYHLLDYYMQQKPFNWIGGYKSLQDSNFARLSKSRTSANIIPNNNKAASLALNQYAGNYHDSFYGDVQVELEGTKLVLRFKHTAELVADLVPFQYDNFLVVFRNASLKADAYASFSIGPDGKVDQLKLKIIDPDCDISFDELLLKPIKQ